MKISERTTLTDLAFIVCTALEEAGITAVLTGGSAATVYAPEYIQSEDLDFVLVSVSGSSSHGVQILESLGFREAHGRYEHPQSPFWLEFPPGPLMIGRKTVVEWNTLRKEKQVLHILTPTDSCCDRLAGYLHWNDQGSLEKAVAVARANPRAVNPDDVRKWCEDERVPERFEVFRKRLMSG